MATFSKALQIAVQGHFDVLDKGGHSYILHPMRIIMRLRTQDEELMSAAAMHDLIEDTNITFEDLYNFGFSDRVVGMVRLLTHQKGISYEQYIENMRGNLGALLIKREDLRDNSDITRLKNKEPTAKDIERIMKYQRAFLRIEAFIKELMP